MPSRGPTEMLRSRLRRWRRNAEPESSAVCPQCGAPLDEHERDVQFRLPSAVLALPERERTEGTWMTDDDPAKAHLMEVPGIGAYVRCLLPVRLTGGYAVTFGVWLEVRPEEFQHVKTVWTKPEYESLVLEGRLANALPIFGLLGSPARATVADSDTKPLITSSTEPGLADVLDREWPHEEVLNALPPL